MNRILDEFRSSPQKIWMLISLLAFITFPSTALIQEHLGLVGLIAYILVVLVVLIGLVLLRTELYDIIDRRFWIFAIVIAVGLIAIFFIVYPMETAGRFSRGSDRDEALNIAVRSIAAGDYPYDARTPLGGPIMQLPGAILLSAPFVALGNSAYQNLLWLAVFAYVTMLVFKNRSAALTLLVAALVLSPALQYEYISGGDLLANGIYVVVFLFLTVQAFARTNSLPWLNIVLSILLGISLSSRPYFFVVIPLLCVVLFRIADRKSAITGAVATTLATLIVTLPYYLYSPGAFTPFTGSRLTALNAAIPHASVVVIVITILLSLVGAFMLTAVPKRDLVPYLYWMSALVIFLSMLSAAVFSSLASGALDFSFMQHRDGLIFLLLGLWGCWPYLFGSRPEPAAQPEPDAG